ncbi:adenosine-deaminase-containing protein [Glarea lozoyensis ATCC 20868]|uniref:Adenosine-deaminase-containing protein n=1 Tax=Glarea lozoyensis (strain ATCC 20868 / MF5171) TaxID=1116229 RepID=S3CIX2_GLAL2|nr:adenosine-deaminase-containing protein [Glarea lozoyensis ATCC 20868]EPE26452.1 adenosine-deaminase-containing protein [Glarea lozoyensis ATCC 20868]
MDVSGDEIADAVLTQFDSWEKKRKPMNRADNVKEWVPLSGIVLHDAKTGTLKCVAAATGMKCLPQKLIPRAQGVTLHDWHAEIFAIRSFNRFILEECQVLVTSDKKSSEYVRRRDELEKSETHAQPFALNDGVNIYMYCSEAPCGDASMELTMAAQEDATPWAKAESSLTEKPILHGRGYFSNLGVTRRKPSRPDAPPTLSKSCTDKIALKQSTSLLSSITSLMVSPENIYIHSLVLPHSQLSTVAVERAFSPSGRLKELDGREWDSGYRFSPFRVLGTTREFSYSRRQNDAKELVPSNISSLWTPYGAETIIGGTMQGRKQFDVRGASKVCKRRLWKLAAEISSAAESTEWGTYLLKDKYLNLKDGDMLAQRRKVKEDVRKVMGGWIRNEGGEDFALDGVES